MNLKTDIYVDNEKKGLDSSLRFVMIEVKNIPGILNRVVSLMRRKRYNLEEVSVSFDQQDHAYMIFAIDGAIHDVNQIVEQIRKLYDVYNAYDITHKYDTLYHLTDVEINNEADLKLCPIKADKIITKEDKTYALFITNLQDSTKLLKFLNEEKFKYVRRVFGLT